MKKVVYLFRIFVIVIMVVFIHHASFSASLHIFYETGNKPGNLIYSNGTIPSNASNIFLSINLGHNSRKVKITSIWYYLSSKKPIKFLTKTLYTADTSTYFNYKKPEKKYFIKGRYRVDIFINRKKSNSIHFSIVDKQRYQLSEKCHFPGDIDDSIFISDAIKHYPSMKNYIKRYGLKRYTDKENRLSLLLPAHWHTLKRGKKILVSLSENKKSGSLAYLALRNLTTNAYKNKGYSDKLILKGMSGVLIDNTKQAGGSIISPFKMIKMKSASIAYFVMLHPVDNVKLWEFHTLFFDGNSLFDLMIFVDKSRLKVGKFLSYLAIHSLWTKKLCSK